MDFLTGLLTGLIISILILLILTFFRSSVERRITVIEKQVMNAGPRPKGFIIEPESEADEVRAEIKKKNNKLGRDTKLEELI